MAGFLIEQTNPVRFAMKRILNLKPDVRKATQSLPGDGQS